MIIISVKISSVCCCISCCSDLWPSVAAYTCWDLDILFPAWLSLTASHVKCRLNNKPPRFHTNHMSESCGDVCILPPPPPPPLSPPPPPPSPPPLSPPLSPPPLCPPLSPPPAPPAAAECFSMLNHMQLNIRRPSGLMKMSFITQPVVDKSRGVHVASRWDSALFPAWTERPRALQREEGSFFNIYEYWSGPRGLRAPS